MKTIPLTQGMVAVVDDSDFDWLSTFSWHAKFADGKWYARKGERTVSPNGTHTVMAYMHRVILGLSKGDPDVDHADGDGLNNQRHNLRTATDAQACMNRSGWSECGFKGVNWSERPRDRHWRAHIRFEKKLIHLGYFSTPQEAALAYNAKALELFGEFARLNPI